MTSDSPACEKAQAFCNEHYKLDSQGAPRVQVQSLLSDHGSRADVFEVVIKQQRYALKIFKTSSKPVEYLPHSFGVHESEHVFRLSQSHRGLQEHIVPHHRMSQILFDATLPASTIDRIAILMDLLTKDEILLRDYCQQATGKKPKDQRWPFEMFGGKHPFEIAKGLTWIFILLLESGTLHGDLDPNNIAIGLSGNAVTVRIFDWGSSIHARKADRHDPNFAESLDVLGEKADLVRLEARLRDMLEIYHYEHSQHDCLLTLLKYVGNVTTAFNDYRFQNGNMEVAKEALKALRDWFERQ